jgi:hypothetical protein
MSKVHKHFPAVNQWFCLSDCSAWLWAVSDNLLLTAEEHSSLLARSASAVPLLSAASREPAGPHRNVTAVDNCTLLLWATAVIVTTFKDETFRFLKRRNAWFVSDWLITPFITRHEVNLDDTYIIVIIRWNLNGWCCVLACFRRRGYVENDVDTDVPLTTVVTKVSTTEFSGIQTAARRLRWFPVSFWQLKNRNCF